MRYKKYIITFLFSCLALGWTGCSEETPFEERANETSFSLKSYNARLITQFNIEISDLEVSVNPISRSAEDMITLSDMWYVVFDTSTRQLVPSVDGIRVRHQILTSNKPDPIEEQLPDGKYIVAFLIMAKGGDANAVQAVESLNDTWLKSEADGTLSGDFFYGQGSATILPGETETLSVNMSRVASLFTIDTKMMNESQKALLTKTEIILDDALPYGSMAVDGRLNSLTQAEGQIINMTDKGGSFFALTDDRTISRKGQLLITLSTRKGMYQRLYQISNLTLERGKRTLHTLDLNLPYDRLGHLGQSDITAQSRMFANNETAEVMKKREFQLGAPLKVIFDKKKTSIQFFSPVGIGHTTIYAKIRSTQDYFKVFELDTIRPFDDITIPSPLLNNEEGYYLAEKGHIIKIPANINLTNDAFEYKVVTPSDYWKKIESIKVSPTIGFHSSIRDGAETLTPYNARLMVGMVLNWGVMLCSPLFEKTLKEWPYPKLDLSGKEQSDFYYATMNGVVQVSKEEIIDRIYNSFGKRIIYFANDPKMNQDGMNGYVTPLSSGPDGRVRCIYALWTPILDTLYKPYQHLGYVPYHELAHLLNYPDSYDVPGGNTMATLGYAGWTSLCPMVYMEMCKNNELPASTLDVISDLDY